MNYPTPTIDSPLTSDEREAAIRRAAERWRQDMPIRLDQAVELMAAGYIVDELEAQFTE